MCESDRLKQQIVVAEMRVEAMICGDLVSDVAFSLFDYPCLRKRIVSNDLFDIAASNSGGFPFHYIFQLSAAHFPGGSIGTRWYSNHQTHFPSRANLAHVHAMNTALICLGAASFYSRFVPRETDARELLHSFIYGMNKVGRR
jgi:hypothetical protein